MDYTKKNIIKSKPGNIFLLLITVALLAYVLLTQFDMVDISWIKDYAPNMQADVRELIVPALVVTGLSVLCMLLIVGSDLVTASKIKKNLAEFNIEDVLDQMNSHSVYVFMNGNNPKFFVTEKYLVASNLFVCRCQDVSWTYLSRYKSVTSFMVTLRNNKELNAGGDIAMKGKVNDCIEAMKQVCPDLLVGVTKENEAEHKARVKETKGK